MSQKAQVYVEFCGAWGYEPRYRELRSMIMQQVPGAVVDGNIGRRSSFEVTINKKLIFSKLGNGSFPDFDAIVEEVVKASKGVETSQVEKVQESSCNIL